LIKNKNKTNRRSIENPTILEINTIDNTAKKNKVLAFNNATDEKQPLKKAIQFTRMTR